MNSENRELSVDQLDNVMGGSVVGDALQTIKQMGEILSNVSETRSEISMTFARNARA